MEIQKKGSTDFPTRRTLRYQDDFEYHDCRDQSNCHCDTYSDNTTLLAAIQKCVNFSLLLEAILGIVKRE